MTEWGKASAPIPTERRRVPPVTQPPRFPIWASYLLGLVGLRTGEVGEFDHQWDLTDKTFKFFGWIFFTAFVVALAKKTDGWLLYPIVVLLVFRLAGLVLLAYNSVVLRVRRGMDGPRLLPALISFALFAVITLGMIGSIRGMLHLIDMIDAARLPPS